MDISSKRFNDSSEPDKNGLYEYRCTGVIYIFIANERKLIFRLYDDEPSIATLPKPSDSYTDLFRTVIFREAVEYLGRTENVTTIKAYNHMTGSYSPISTPGGESG